MRLCQYKQSLTLPPLQVKNESPFKLIPDLFVMDASLKFQVHFVLQCFLREERAAMKHYASSDLDLQMS